MFLKYDKEKAQEESIDIGDILSEQNQIFVHLIELAVFSFDSSRDYDSEIKSQTDARKKSLDLAPMMPQTYQMKNSSKYD